jgi:hypothetical protein
MAIFIRGHALIIGIGSYQHSSRHNVPITVADAQTVGTTLQNDQFYGYPAEQAALLSDGSATCTGILSELDKLAQINGEGVVMLFYSVHGDYDDNRHDALTRHDALLLEYSAHLWSLSPSWENLSS